MEDLFAVPADQTQHVRLRLLLVDDDDDDRAAVRRALAAAGLDTDIEEATTAVQALARLSTGNFDIALLADLSGEHRLHLLRKARDVHVDFPLIVLSARGDERMAVEVIKAGAADYLPKGSLTAGQLEQSIRTALRVQRAERDALLAGKIVNRHIEQLHELARAAVRMSAALDIETLLDESAECARTILATHEAVVTFAPAGDWGRATTRQSLSERYSEFRSLVPDPDRSGLLDTIRAEGRVVRLGAEELARHPAFRKPDSDEDWRLPLRGWLAAPLLGPAGQNIGVLQLSDRTIGDFVAADEAVLLQLAQLVSASLENARLYAAATEAASARERVLATVSHDLRNPLNTILMGASLLLDTNPPPEQARKQLQVIRNSVDTMNRMIEDLLDISRIEARHLSIEPQEIDTAPAVHDACDMLEPLASEKGLHLDCRLADSLPPIVADRDRLLQVFSNLVGNAIKFTEPGGRVTIFADNDDGEIRFAVRDDGPGIARDDLLHIFEPFWQGDPRTGREGAGLGLTIARGIIEAHGGQLSCVSAPGDGTTFIFTVPVADRAPARMRAD